MSDLHPLTVASIEAQGKNAPPCLCEGLGILRLRYLCGFHQGYNAGIEALIVTMCGPK